RVDGLQPWPGRPLASSRQAGRTTGEVLSTDVAVALAVSLTSEALARGSSRRANSRRGARGGRRATAPTRPARVRLPINARRTLYGIVQRDGRITRQGFAAEAGLSGRTAGRLLAGMVARGALVP